MAPTVQGDIGAQSLVHLRHRLKSEATETTVHGTRYKRVGASKGSDVYEAVSVSHERDEQSPCLGLQSAQVAPVQGSTDGIRWRRQVPERRTSRDAYIELAVDWYVLQAVGNARVNTG
jgi:hypothetical protein